MNNTQDLTVELEEIVRGIRQRAKRELAREIETVLSVQVYNGDEYTNPLEACIQIKGIVDKVVKEFGSGSIKNECH